MSLIPRAFKGRFAKRGGSKYYQNKKKMEALGALKSLHLKIKNGEMIVEDIGMWQGESKDSWIFRIVMKESEISVLSEELLEK